MDVPEVLGHGSDRTRVTTFSQASRGRGSNGASVFIVVAHYIESLVEGCLERIGEHDSEGEDILRGEWEEVEREVVLEVLKSEVEVRSGRPENSI